MKIAVFQQRGDDVTLPESFVQTKLVEESMANITRVRLTLLNVEFIRYTTIITRQVAITATGS